MVVVADCFAAARGFSHPRAREGRRWPGIQRLPRRNRTVAASVWCVVRRRTELVMHIVAATARSVRWPLEPSGAARGRWRERERVIVAVRSDDGSPGLGAAAPLPGMTIDTLEA